MVVNLNFKKNDLIIKEGNYGVSIYKIIKGKVRIFMDSGDDEMTLAILGPGDILGEMTFLNRNIVVRSASAKAIQDSELEAWHPDLLEPEYERMPEIVKLIIHETLARLIRMNKFICQMTPRKEERIEGKASKTQKTSRRIYYRKKVDLPCTLRPAETPSKLSAYGHIKDISLMGMRMEVKGTTMVDFSHDPGDEFDINLILPNGKDVYLTARILSSRKPHVSGMFSFGMIFTNMREGSNKELGFFLMP